MEDIKIFDRIEKKYLINAETKKRLLKTIQEHMKKDSYFRSEVFNVYFDTDNFDFIIRSIEQPKFKVKLRARSYGGYDKVFFEVKTKMRGKEANVGYKRRVLVTLKDYDLLVSGKKNMMELAAQKIETPADMQIAREVDYLIQQFNLKPKFLVYYDRESYKGENELRITFDENLRYRENNLKFMEKTSDKRYFNDEKNIIMEIKAHGAMPLWLVRELSAAKVYPQRFSKIGNIYTLTRKEQNV